MTRLSDATLIQLPHDVERPAFDRNSAGTGIVHLGAGAFHRAHQAVYTDQAMGVVGGDWLIEGVSLRSSAVRAQMNPQDGLYSVLEETGTESRLRVIGAIRQVLFLPDEKDEIVNLMSREETRIVSLTITEKGYCRVSSSGRLDLDHPDIVHDLEDLQTPRSAIGLIVLTLRNRRDADIPPYTVLSCDNLPNNGMTLRRVILEFAKEVDAELMRWIEREVSFPSTMVDRIVPAQTDELKKDIAGRLGMVDEACVGTEPFSQWVIEDKFPGGRPAWEEAGAIFASDVAPYEEMKLRLLNGAHSTIAYLGCLSGLETVADCMAREALREFVENLMKMEVAPTITPPADYDINAYIEVLIDRFCNTRLQHKCSQIAMDGSQKIPQRLLSTVADRLQEGSSIGRLSLGIAAWILYCTGQGERGETFEVDDPIAADLERALRPSRHDAVKLAAVALSETRVFSQELARNEIFRENLTRAIAQLLEHGAHGALDHV